MLLEWLEGRGATFGPVEVRGEPRGVFATAALPAGALVARIPGEAVLSNHVAVHTTRAGELQARGEAPEGLLLTVAVLALRASADPSWAPYLGDLPARVDGHPASWPAAVRRGVQGTNLAELLIAFEERMRGEVAMLRRSALGFSSLSYATWLATRSVVTSRRFTHDSGSALVPFGDLLNHAVDPEVDWDWVEGAFVLTTRRAVPAGAELHDSYGSKSNTRLLLTYGFTLPDNPDDEVFLARGGDDVVLLPRADAPRAAEVEAKLGLDRARERRRLRAELEARLPRLPEPDPALPIDARRIVEGERAVVAGWIARLGAG